MQSKNWWELDSDELKSKFGYRDLSKNSNALPIPFRRWDRLNECVIKHAQKGEPYPYSLRAYILGAIKIIPNDKVDIADVKPNTILALALQESFCGKKYNRYKEGYAPLILRLQKNKLLISALRELFFGEEDAKKLRKKPILLEFFGFSPFIKGVKPFEAGILERAPSLESLSIHKELKQFKKLLHQSNLNLAENSIVVISQSDFENAYKEAFGELLERSKESEDEFYSEDYNGDLDDLGLEL